MLFVFDLNGVLGFASNEHVDKAQTFYNKPHDYEKDRLKVWHRPNINLITK